MGLLHTTRLVQFESGNTFGAFSGESWELQYVAAENYSSHNSPDAAAKLLPLSTGIKLAVQKQRRGLVSLLWSGCSIISKGNPKEVKGKPTLFPLQIRSISCLQMPVARRSVTGSTSLEILPIAGNQGYRCHAVSSSFFPPAYSAVGPAAFRPGVAFPLSIVGYGVGILSSDPEY